MRCRGCFARFEDVRSTVLPRGHLPRERALELTGQLADAFDKVTFVGGEPTLCPWWEDLVCLAKSRGATTMLVTNGTRVDADTLERLRGKLDWFTLSIDSPNDETHRRLGRAFRGAAVPSSRYVELLLRAQSLGYQTKINTVVSKENVGESFAELLSATRPNRWKVFQVLPVKGQNDQTVESLLVEPDEFRAFIERHRAFSPVEESNEAMTGSYAMVDPAGRFFDNATGQHRYSAPILEAGLERAWSGVHFDRERFDARGGEYAWR